ncbi:Oidioi.mRNA.OKI2018_I69.chr2.g7297.t1.cds [Oikopleura dioica]|uniref:Oidioi.mRNA.OKI2018_I69.chr2.g7297.t1.cds n=1 Tax=Oikopleura dioica TaxID=34765 RepID=A0ABN7TBR4_OIKDI|nr:Oidioi.mRNA.OKI2018_I69.chr2.g7297.t1.cds [Oikopleura dioica]
MDGNSSVLDDPAAYPTCAMGMILPLVDESNMSMSIRILMYLVGLFWFFVGVAIVADIFMVSIEVITSKETHITVLVDGQPEKHKVRFWNATVANLTLMAMGSSMPEIFLNIIEIVFNKFETGALGPGTIVGSAAFNLMVIIGVCTFGIPDGEKRRIDRFYVYGITAFFSIFAYVWLLIILRFISPGVVDLWEALVTLLMFPLLVGVAYLADRNMLCGQTRSDDDDEGQKQIMEYNPDTPEGIELLGKNRPNSIALVDEFMKDFEGDPLTIDEQAAAIAVASKMQGPSQGRSRAWYRVQATRTLTAGARIEPNKALSRMARSFSNLPTKNNTSEFAMFNFACTSSSVMENAKQIELKVMRSGNVEIPAKCNYETIDGTATKGEDYVENKGVLEFGPRETQKSITVEIIDDDQWEPDETFFVKLFLGNAADPRVKLGDRSINQVTIINDDDPGTFQFKEPAFMCKESQGVLKLPVCRTNGADGTVSVEWQCKGITATHGSDFKEDRGTLVFNHGETQNDIEITIIQTPDKEPDETFKVSIVNVSKGAQMGHTRETVVTIIGDEEYKNLVKRVAAQTHVALSKMEIGGESWYEQFVQAMNVNGGDIENATGFDYFMHLITFGFKTIFAIIPPANMGGGFPCFFGSLIMIGLMTTIISDFANIFGCLVGLKPAVNSITLVALGTSLPDLFASKIAATNEPNADDSVGNVTGSNSVNVFLGLGLPWTMAAIYHASQGSVFQVPAGSLAFSVTVFSICAVTTIGFLFARRTLSYFGNAELGGPNKQKWASGIFLITLWLFYVLMSTLQAYDFIPGF